MISDVFSVIMDQWRGIFGSLLLIALGQTLISTALQYIFGKQLTPSEYFSLGMAGWLLPASFISMLWFFAGWKLSSPFNLILLISLLISSVLFRLRFKPDPVPDSKSTSLFLFLFFLLSSLLRLVFVSKVTLPSYFDSASHYMLIKTILGSGTGLLTSLQTSYYHLGYHILAAFTVSTFQVEITKTMLILGQMVLAVIPLSVFFLIKHETKSSLAGIFVVILAAYGWYMPAHAVDWGKYPALLSMGLFPFVLSLAYLISQNKHTDSPRKRWLLYLMLAAGILISGILHSRSLVVIGITCLAWTVAAWQQKLPRLPRTLLFAAVIIALALEIIYIQRQDVLTLLFDPYIQKGLLVTALVLLLSIFAQRHYPQLTLTCILAAGLFMSSLFIPVTGLVPGYANLTLLDRPYVEMILFLPLSFLGGLGFAGVEKSFQHTKFKTFAGLITCGLILINAFATYNLSPWKCCVIAGNDDVTAIDWMNNQLPTNARIGISATELKVLASDSFEGYVGGDAGIWITPLIGRVTVPVRYDTDFSGQAALDNLCQQGISHLYVGGLGQNFNDSQLNNQPAWYKMLLSMPEVKVYQVVGCK